MKIPSVEDILKETEEKYDEISNNIALMVSQVPNNLVESPSNTNMLLVLKRYIMGLKGKGILIQSDEYEKIVRLVSTNNNVTTTSFIKLTELLRIRWEIRLVNPNHEMYLVADTHHLFDERKKLTEDFTDGNMLLWIMRYVVNNYGQVDLRLNTNYVPPYNVSNLVAAIRSEKHISSYLFEKFCKLWNISYSYEIISVENDQVREKIEMDPSGWL